MEVFDLVGKANCEAHLAIFFCLVLHGDYLDRTKQRHKPGMIIPGALIFRVSEVGVF